jgi:hypothetical protein
MTLIQGNHHPTLSVGGGAAVEEFTELRWVTVQSDNRHFPF